MGLIERFITIPATARALAAGGAVAFMVASDALAQVAQPPATGQPQPAIDSLHGPYYTAAQVETVARPAPGNGPPAYPPELRRAGIQGSVRLSFLVNEQGRALVTTATADSSSHPGFTAAVLGHLPTMRFVPATIAGVPVKQRVEMPFVFTLSR